MQKQSIKLNCLGDSQYITKTFMTLCTVLHAPAFRWVVSMQTNQSIKKNWEHISVELGCLWNVQLIVKTPLKYYKYIWTP